MHSGLKISHKGIILVAIPVVFELIFVSILIVMLQQAEADLERESRSKEIIYNAGVFGRNVAEGATVVAAYTTTHSDYFKEKYEGNRKGIHRQLRKLKVLLTKADKKEQLERLKRLEATAIKGEAILEKIVKTTDKTIAGESSGYAFSGPLAMVTSKKLIDEIMRNVQAILEEEKQLAETYLEAAAKSRERLQYLIIGFVGFNIFLAVLLANFFSKSITKRIKSVIDNTYRVPRGEDLTPPIGGSDEIAELDIQFHEMVDELYKAQKMKQYLLSMVSHDLRSPLTSVQGLLTMLAAGAFGEISEKAKKRVTTAEAEVKRLIDMTNDLLDVERLASGTLEMEMEETTSTRVIDATIGSMQALAEQHKVALARDDGEIDFRGDTDRLVQVMVNLVGNAVKFSPADSTITLIADRQDNNVLFSVKDQGRGIPPDYIDKVFEKFQQVEESDSSEKGGKGLGLSICKSIVEAHGGTIGVESTFGEGSTFWFLIPSE